MKNQIKNKHILSDILLRIENGDLDPLSALTELGVMQNKEKLKFARIDHSRKFRCGFPEFIYGEGKTPEQIVKIIGEISKRKQAVLVTRLSQESASVILKKISGSIYDNMARVLVLFPHRMKKRGKVLIVTAGTVDMPVALEAKLTAEACGCGTELIPDIGVAGLHRTISCVGKLKKADVIIAVAGMEGALPSVIGGLVSCPVIAVPTSAGYGTSLGGLTAMFAMLNSCASGVLVTNINNGFGAGCAAARIINK